MPFRLLVPDLLCVVPLTTALDPGDGGEILIDTPANVSVRFSGPDERFDAALLTPFDYARHGGSFRIVPGIAVSAVHPPGTTLLRIRPGARHIRSIATDLRSTGDIALASLLIREKFPSAGESGAPLSVVPVRDVETAGFGSADAVLHSATSPVTRPLEGFVLDLHEEWMDLLERPLPLHVWVVREGAEPALAELLIRAAVGATSALGSVAPPTGTSMTHEELMSFFSRFAYGLNDDHVDTIDSLFRVAYGHGVLGDVPDLRFLLPPAS